MNQFRSIALAAAAASALWASASSGLGSPAAEGYLLRGELLYANHIYQGTVDQLSHISALSPDPTQAADALYTAALAELHAGSSRALPMLREYLEKYPGSALTPLVQTAIGDYYFAHRQYAEANNAYNRVDERTLAPSATADLRYRRAYALLLCGHPDEAATRFEALLTDKLYGNAARFYLGYIAYQKGEYDRAMQLFADVDRKTAPGNTVAAYIAQIQFSRKEYAGALAEARKVIADPMLNAYHPEAQRVAGESLYNMGRRSDALPYLWKYAAVTEAPEPSALYILGTAEYDAGHYAEATGLLQKALAGRDAIAQSAYLYLGQAYSKRDNHRAALLAFENAYRLDIDPKVTETALYNYVVEKMSGETMPFTNSAELMESFMRRFPNSEYTSRIGEYLAAGYMRENDYQNALAVIDRIAHPSSRLIGLRQRAQFMQGTRELTNSAPRRALEQFNCSAAGPDAAIALQSRLWRGDALYSLGQYDKAITDLTYFINHSPANEANLAVARYDLAYALFAIDNYSGASREFREYITLAHNPKPAQLADVYNRLGDCDYYSGNFADAEANYNRAAATDPSKADYAMYQSALMMGLRRNHRGKIEAIDKLTATYPASALVAPALLAKAESQSALADNNGACATLRTIVEKFGSSAHGRRAALQLAITYQSMGKSDQAVAAYKRVIENYPSSEESRLAVDDLKRIFADAGRLDEFRKYIAAVPDAPAIDPSEYDTLEFQAAEKRYIADDSTDRLETYITRYPNGANRARAFYYLATAANSDGKPAKALEYAEKLLASYPDAETAEEALLLKAETEFDLGRINPALTSFTELEKKSSSPDIQREARLGIMRSAEKLGHHAEVVEVTERLLATSAATSAENAEILHARASALAATGQYDSAEKIWQQVVDTYGSDIYASQSAVELAQMRLDRKQLKSARKGIEKFINSNPPQQYWLARGFVVLSDILRAQGETFEADEYLRSLRNNYPGTEKDIFNMIDERLK